MATNRMASTHPGLVITSRAAGFSLIELVIVIVILGILAVTALPRFLDVTDEAKKASVEGVSGGFATGVSLVRAQWEAEGRAKQDSLNTVLYDGSRFYLTTPTDSQVSADRVQLQQVIINLIINACQAMDAANATQRTLSIRTWVKDNEAVLEVADQGPGIAAEVLPQLFTPFFTTKENGLGMGLCICRSIIDFHGGRIWAASTKGQGCSFLFALPTRVANDAGFAAAI